VRTRRRAFLLNVGAKVRARRARLSLTQSELAARAKLHVNVIGRVERGQFNPTVMTLVAIANALRISITRLV
jgi:transcriptional regulator with XRE-family HTH domain